jgi:hypothetical protein
MKRRIPAWRPSRWTPYLVLACSVALGACEHPIPIVTPHVEAADLVIADSAGGVLARTEFNRTWSVPELVLVDGAPLRVVLTPLDFRGQPMDLSGRQDLSFRLEVRDGALLQWEPQRGFAWIRPFGTGATRVRFLIWHGTHADFVTPWLDVVIHPRPVRGIQRLNSNRTDHGPG